MFALMAVTIAHQGDLKRRPAARARGNQRNAGGSGGSGGGDKTHAPKERTFMDIFACRRCKKNRGQRQNCVDNEGYSSADEDSSVGNASATSGKDKAEGRAVLSDKGKDKAELRAAISGKGKGKDRAEPRAAISSTGKGKGKGKDKAEPRAGKEEDSLRRPLQCKQSLVSRRQSHVRLRHIDDSSSTSTSAVPSERFLDGWHSLPNLRSPSLTVRAMTLKLTSLRGAGDENSGGAGSDVNERKAKTTKKRARFNETVDVILQDDNGEPLYAQFVRIKYDDDDDDGGAPGDRRRVNGHAMATRSGATGSGASNGPTEGATGGGGGGGGATGARSNPDAIRMDLMDIRRNADGQRYLKCVIFVGEQFDRRRITVRTAMGGSRLVLIAYKTEPLGDGTYYWQQFVERFRLPHAIDPHRVDAVMHSAGDLVIQAPLFDFEVDS